MRWKAKRSRFRGGSIVDDREGRTGNGTGSEEMMKA
jgi:hypothetical protein